LVTAAPTVKRLVLTSYTLTSLQNLGGQTLDLLIPWILDVSRTHCGIW